MKGNHMKHIFGLATVFLMIASPALAQEQKATPAAQLVDLRVAPVSPAVLTDGKKEDAAALLLRAGKRENVSGGKAFEALIARQKARDAALIQIIGPDSSLTHTFAEALEKRLGGLLAGQAAPENSRAIALQMVQSIFLNRRDDLTSLQAFYDDAAWRKDMQQRLKKGDAPALNVSLSETKRAELQNTALYVHTPGNADGKIEPAVHLLLTALAHQIGHAALADVTKPGTPVHAAFHQAIAKALPKDDSAKEWLNDWLTLRAGRAEAVAVDFRPDGELMQEAVAKSEAARRARAQNPPKH